MRQIVTALDRRLPENAWYRAAQGRPAGRLVTANDASIAALRTHTQQRSNDVRRRIDQALRDLRRKGAAVNVAAVAARAGVTRKAVYSHPELLARIRAHTNLAAFGGIGQ